jgi:hypothetical protein
MDETLLCSLHTHHEYNQPTNARDWSNNRSILPGKAEITGIIVMVEKVGNISSEKHVLGGVFTTRTRCGLPVDSLPTKF